MKLIVGLGNPGEKYVNTRHNVGFQVIGMLTKDLKIPHPTKKLDSLVFEFRRGDAIIAAPQTFMNNSGSVVSKLMNKYKVSLDELWIVHDDLDIPIGKYKIQKGVGPKVHGGLTSIENAVGKNFNRVRVGVDNRVEDIPGEKYVLEKFTGDELIVVNRIINEIVGEIRKIIKK